MAILHAVIKMGYQRSRTLTNCSNRGSAFNGYFQLERLFRRHGGMPVREQQRSMAIFPIGCLFVITPSALAMLVGA
jgi:hypothetical protein